VALDVRDDLDLDLVVLVVANEPWQKVGSRTMTPAEDRLAMVAETVDEIEGLEASRIEIARGGPSYTVDTVRELRAVAPEDAHYLVVGSDVARHLDTWERMEELQELVTLVIVDRAGMELAPDPPGWEVTRVAVPRLDVSSSDLRQRLEEGRSVTFLMPDPAISCIRRRGLYAKRR
jgi:nicotinate-nucleotide adenylyltransferase